MNIFRNLRDRRSYRHSFEEIENKHQRGLNSLNHNPRSHVSLQDSSITRNPVKKHLKHSFLLFVERLLHSICWYCLTVVLRKTVKLYVTELSKTILMCHESWKFETLKRF